ncbi:MAG: hypothetical protein UMS36scaffold28_31 [Phage 59_13]|nr:MAG: hypothetical protein UMS36scaffold28_31 [Phage 59_13]
MIDPMTKKECACPLNGKICIDGSREDFPANAVGGKIICRWWQHLAGKDPQSEKQVDHFDCAVAWLPVTTTETAQRASQTAASVDKVASTITGLKADIANVVDALEIVGHQIRKGLEQGGVALMLPPEREKGNGK